MRRLCVSGTRWLVVGIMVAAQVPGAARSDEAATPAAPSKVLFETHVAPLLEANCLKCHGAT